MPTQRETMRQIYDRSPLKMTDAERAEHCATMYALCEQSGGVLRESNTTGMKSIDYAKALYADGVKKGWLNA